MKKTAFLLCFIMVMNHSYSQKEFEIKTLKSDLKNNAIGFIINYLSDYSGIDFQKNFKKAFATLTPEIITKAGTSDAFSQITLKLSGFYLSGRDTTIAGLPHVINTTRTLHVFPASLGIETSSDFNFLNSIVEFGYTPVYYLPGNKHVSNFIKHTQFGIFLQAGYKSELDTALMSKITGGKVDESSEKLNTTIFRSKATLNIDTKNLFQANNIGFGLIGKANYWFDFINSKSYYNIEGKFRIYLSQNKYFDLTYEKGSGAPNFNQGDQFGLGLSVAF